MIAIQQHCSLTPVGNIATMRASVSRLAGFSSSKSNGVVTPTNGVFFRPKKIATPLVRVLSMVARSGQPQGWPVSTKPLWVPLPGTANSLRAAAQQLAVVGGGFIHAMEIVKMTIQSRATVAPVRLTLPVLINKTRIAFGLDRPFKPRIVIYRTADGQIDIINRDHRHGVTAAQRDYMLDQIAAHGGIVGGAK